MVQLMSRCISFAEGLVTMVCPVLLALCLKKDMWKSKVHEPVLPTVMLVVAGATLVTGILPVLACCIYQRFPFHRWEILSSVTRVVGATLSSAGLLFLACWVSWLSFVSKDLVIVFGFMLGIFLVIRFVSYPAAWLLVDDDQNGELRTIVDKSHEFLSGVTGILFLGLEGMALEGLVSVYLGTEPNALQPHMSISFFVCAVGLILMFVEMTPPPTAARMKFVVCFTDAFMAVGTGALLTVIMTTLSGKYGFAFLSFPFLIFLQLVYRVARPKQQAGKNQREEPKTKDPEDPEDRGDKNQREEPKTEDPEDRGDKNQREEPKTENSEDRGDINQREEPKTAPMGLTKVTFTGFLAVSVRAISGGSPSYSTIIFLCFAAAAIASGVSWRLLTHTQNKGIVGGEAAADEAANFASFCTHFCVTLATVFFTVMAWKAGSTK